MRNALLYLFAWCACAAAIAAKPPEPGIASAHPLATAAGAEMLERGGNAFDAAVAVASTLAVVEPYASGLGGGGFFLLHLAGENRDVFVDAREVAPAAATATMYLDESGEPIPRASFDGPLAAGIPGQPAGLVHLAERYGSLDLATLLAPAIRHAREGFPAHRRLLLGLRFRRKAAEASPAFMEIFYPGGDAPEIGDIVRQPALAETLARLAARGFDGYYKGRTARRLVRGVRDGGGIWSRRDLANYRVIERAPLVTSYRGVRIVTAPLPSAGGIAIANILNIYDGYDHARLSPADRKHVLVEAMRRAYRDRVSWLGDPGYVDVPVAMLTSPWYAAGQRASIRMDRATPSDDLPGIRPAPGGGTETTHFSVLDGDGNRVAATLSINTWYGAAYMVPGTGVILNNEMDDFSTKPGVPDGFGLIGSEANAIAPGKRMLSSMTPTFMESDRGVAILGTPGGSRIITMVLLAGLAWMDGGDANEMVARKRFHHQYYPDEVAYESGALTDAEIESLAARGHRLGESRRPFGNMNVVVWDFGADAVEAASDPRGGEEGRVY